RVAALRTHIRECWRYRADLAAPCVRALSWTRCLDLRFLALVLYLESFGRDGGKFLSLPHAAARHVVWLAAAGRTRVTARSTRDRSGCARHLSGDAAGQQLRR